MVFTLHSKSLVMQLICLLFQLCFMETVVGSSHQLNDRGLCDSLNIGHPEPESLYNNSVMIQLYDKNSGRPVDCYEPRAEYSILISTEYKDINGLLFVQSKVNPGVFHTPLQAELQMEPCGNRAISHISSSKGVKCNLRKNIHIDYTTPDSSAENLEFKYIVTFGWVDYIKSNISFPRCPQRFCHSNKFIQDPSIKALRQKCPNKYSKSLVTPEDRSYTDNSTGIKYNCVVADNSTTVQRKQCTTGCSKTIDGVDTKLCCKVKINMTVSRLFKCFPMNDSEEEEDSENGVIEMYFDVLNQRKCDCFRCDAICPHPSVNDNNDSKTDNDLTEESPSEEVTLEEPTLDLTQQ